VLVVEDERRLREMLLASLQEMGMTPTGAPTAEGALKLLGQGSFAVALIDLNLPGMSGMEFCEIVHRRWPAIQMVILTGFGDIEAAKRAIRLDVVDFLTKPCGMDELEVALGRARQRWIDHWMAELQQVEASAPHSPRVAVPSAEVTPPQSVTSVEAMERQLILAALERHHGNREAAAVEVGISVRKLYYRLQQYQREGLVPPK
jgi:DNA-binding NtrC family response regulator